MKGSLSVNGKIMINGCEADATRMAMISSYIQQDDLFFGTLTVKEHLVFNVIFLIFIKKLKKNLIWLVFKKAMLRMDKNISKEAKMRRVYQVLKEVLFFKKRFFCKIEFISY